MGVIDSDACEQHASPRSPAAVIEPHEADASTVTSDAPMSAPRAIDERRSLLKMIGMVPFRNSQSPLSTAVNN